MRLRWSLPLLALAACSPAPPAVAPAPAPSASVAPAASSASSNWTTLDPRAVRCGIDDRPQSVIGLASAPSFTLAKLELAAPEPMPAPPATGAGLAMPRRIEDVIDVPPAQPTPKIVIRRPTPSLASGNPLPVELSVAFQSINPQYEICNNLLAQEAPPPSQVFDLELASSGAPLRVTPTAEGQPSAHTRCLMERTCQLQTRAPLGQLTHVRVPVEITREMPPPPTPPTPPVQLARVDVASDAPSASASAAELQLQLRTALADAARGCGVINGRARVRFVVELRRNTPPRVMPSPRRRRPMPVMQPFFSVTQVRSQNLDGVVDNGTIGCVVSAINGRSFLNADGPAVRSERTTLTWNP